jgi:hypothetical protein
MTIEFGLSTESLLVTILTVVQVRRGAVPATARA